MSTGRKGTRVPVANTPRAPSHPVAGFCRDALVVVLAVVICDPELAAILAMIALLFGATIALMRLGLM